MRQLELRRRPGIAAFAMIADRLREQGELSEATWVCSRGLAASPGYAAGHAILAEILLAEGLRRRAKEEFSIALSLDPPNVRARLELAALLIDEGETRQALDHIDQLLFWQPASEEARELAAKATAQHDTKDVARLVDTHDPLAASPIEQIGDALPNPPGLVRGREAELARLLAECESVESAAVIDREALIAASDPPYPALSEEAAASLVHLCSTTQRYLLLLGAGILEGCLIEGAERSLRVLRYQDHVVAVSLAPEARLGPAETELHGAITRLDRRRRVRASDAFINDVVLGKDNA